MVTQAYVKGKIMQGDAYPVPVYVTIDGNIATEENVTELVLRIGDYTARWPEGGLIAKEGVWLFPLTQAQSLGMRPGLTPVQGQIRVGDYTIRSEVSYVYVGKSHLKGEG